MADRRPPGPLVSGSMSCAKRYLIVERDGRKGIKCLMCGMTSWNSNDVVQRYCGGCHVFHDEPGRKHGRTSTVIQAPR